MSPFPQPTMNPGPSRNVQSLSAASDTASAEALGSSCAEAHDPEHEDDPGGDEHGFHHPSSYVADRENLVLPPHDRIQNDGRTDVRDDQQEFE